MRQSFHITSFRHKKPENEVTSIQKVPISVFLFAAMSLLPSQARHRNITPMVMPNRDTEEGDLIIEQNEVISDPQGQKYTVVERAGGGQLGQVYHVVAADNTRYALKVIKWQPVYSRRGQQEYHILAQLQRRITDDERDKIVKPVCSFMFRNHFCFVMELLGLDMYSVLRRRGFRGIGLVLLQRLLCDMLQALCALKRCNIVHADIRPENILTRTSGVGVKLTDFGGARGGSQACGFYIQSRYYRAPEVILEVPYSYPIDMWSLGCVIVEMFVGAPIFPGQSDVHMLDLIVSVMGQFPEKVVARSDRRAELFNPDGTFKGQEKVCREKGQEPVDFATYFRYNRIEEIILLYEGEIGNTDEERQRERDKRMLLLDLVLKMLALDQDERITPEAALAHPFVQLKLDP